MKTPDFPPNFTIRENVLLADYTNIRVGGPADFLCEVADPNIFIDLYRYCRGIGLPFLALGDGTNVFFSEEGFRGLVAIIKFNRAATVTGAAVVAERADAAILAGATADRIAEALATHADAVSVTLAPDLHAAVPMALQAAGRAGVVLLSPACASFDAFRSYAHRGDAFRLAVQQLARAVSGETVVERRANPHS